MRESPTNAPVKPRTTGSIALAAGVIALAVVTAYHNSLSGELVLDDYASIADNASIRQFWSPQVFSPPQDAGVGGRPLANLSFALNYALSGREVWSYHLLNVVLHLGAALTLFGLLRRIFLSAFLREGLGSLASPAALAVATVWALHPVNTAVVDYASQRTEVLMGLFYLLTLYAFVRAMETSSKLWLSLSWVACLLAMLAKEVAVTAPVAVLFFDRAFFAQSFREVWQRRRGFYLALACTWLPLLWSAANLSQRGAGFGLGLSAFDYALIESRAVLRYLQLALWPHPLIFDYGWIAPPRLREVLPNLVALGLALAAIVIAWRQRPRLGFAAGWFFVILLPTSTVVPIALQPIAENRVYLPLIGIVSLAVVAGCTLFGRRSPALWLACAVAGGLATFSRNITYRTEESLWAETLNKNPTNPRAHHNLGTVWLRANRVPDAIAQFEAAVRLKPDYAEAHNGLGNALLASGRHAEAIAQFETALRFDPTVAIAHANLANALLATGRTAEALAHCDEALRLRPNLADLHNNRGSILRQAGRLVEAQRAYEEAVRLNPEFAAAHCNLGAVLLLEGQQAAALAHFARAVKLQPDYFDARISLGVALAQLGQLPNAIREFEFAVKISPQSALAHFNLAQSLLTVGRAAEAVEHLEATLKIQPDFDEAHKSLEQIKSRSAAPRP